MSIRVSTSSLISGAVVVGDPGHGVLGSEVPTTGDHGGGIASTWLAPEALAKEVRVLITSWPETGTLFVHEDTSFEYDGPSTSFSAQLYVTGEPIGSPQPITLTIGDEVTTGEADGALDTVTLQAGTGAAAGAVSANVLGTLAAATAVALLGLAEGTTEAGGFASGPVGTVFLVAVSGAASVEGDAEASSNLDPVGLSAAEAYAASGLSSTAFGYPTLVGLSSPNADITSSVFVAAQIKHLTIYRASGQASAPTGPATPLPPMYEVVYRGSGYVSVTKDVGESYLLSLDIQHLTQNPGVVEVTCNRNPKSPRRGSTDPQDMLLGSPTIESGSIRQRISGGDPDAKYVIQASVTDSVTGEVLVETWLLRVERKLNNPQ